MFNARLTKRIDKGYKTVTFYSGNVGKGDIENESNGSGKLVKADLGCRTTTHIT